MEQRREVLTIRHRADGVDGLEGRGGHDGGVGLALGAFVLNGSFATFEMIVELPCTCRYRVGFPDEGRETQLKNVNGCDFGRFVICDGLLGNHTLRGPGQDESVVIFGYLDQALLDPELADSCSHT